MTADARTALVRELDDAVRAVDGTGFRVTPFARSDALSDALGFTTDGGVWVKDETGNVAGSHKARHLFTILLHLRAAELLGLAPWSQRRDRPPARDRLVRQRRARRGDARRAAAWPIEVFVPDWADPAVVARLDRTGRRDHHVRATRRRSAGRPVRAPVP